MSQIFLTMSRMTLLVCKALLSGANRHTEINAIGGGGPLCTSRALLITLVFMHTVTQPLHLENHRQHMQVSTPLGLTVSSRRSSAAHAIEHPARLDLARDHDDVVIDVFLVRLVLLLPISGVCSAGLSCL